MVIRELSIAFAGRGGQGIVFAATTLATALYRAGAYVAQLQSYGAEVRGGSVLAYVVLSKNRIENPFPETFDIVITLHDAGVARRASSIRASRLIIYEEELVKSLAGLNNAVPVTLAEDVMRRVGKDVVNAAALGLLAGLAPELKDVLRDVLRSGKEGETNLAAFSIGFEKADSLSIPSELRAVIKDVRNLLASLR